MLIPGATSLDGLTAFFIARAWISGACSRPALSSLTRSIRMAVLSAAGVCCLSFAICPFEKSDGGRLCGPRLRCEMEEFCRHTCVGEVPLPGLTEDDVAVDGRLEVEP